MRSSIVSKIKKLKKIILKSDRGQILIHTSPDGDAVASAIAVYRIIRKLTGKSYHLYCPKPIPKRYRFFLHSSQFRTKPIKVPISIVLDTGSLSRLPGWNPAGFIVNIDHHDSNPKFGDINIVDPKSSSAVEILMTIFSHWKVKIDQKTANILYAGIFAETGGFTFCNTRASSLLNAARLVHLGASPAVISEKINNQSLGRLKLLSSVIATLKIVDGIAMVTVSQEMFRKTKTTIDETEGFVELPLAIPGIKISILLKELEDGRTKVSLRSKDKVDVNHIAQHFGGGGHLNAAGFIINRSVATTKKLLIKRVEY